MKKLLMVFIIASLLLQGAVLASDSGDMQGVKDTIEDYFNVRYQMLSRLDYHDDVKAFLSPLSTEASDTVNEADVLETIIAIRKSQVNDLRFERYKKDITYQSIQISGENAWVILSESYELYYNCARTVKNSSEIQHVMLLKKLDSKWVIAKDDYSDPDGVKKKLFKYFIEKQISVDEAKQLVTTEYQNQANMRVEMLQTLAGAIDDGGTMVLFTQKPVAYAAGKAGRIDDNSSVVPVLKEGKVLLPLRYIAENLGAEAVEWVEDTSTAVIRAGGHIISITIGENSIGIDNSRALLSVPACIINDRTMVPADAIAGAFDKNVMVDESGLIMIGSKVFDRNANKALVSKLVEYYSVLFTKADFPRIDGSTATYPLSMEVGKELLGLDDLGAKGFITHNTTHNAYVNLIDGKADIIFVTEPSKDELQLAEQKGIKLEVVPVCKEGFVFLVNENNPVDNLSSSQVRDIYQGKIKNWKEAGGEDNTLIAYQREPNSGSQTIMENTVMKGLKIAKAPTEEVVFGMGELIDRVADYSNARNALGYSVYYYATSMYQSRAVKLLKIDGVAPDKQTIKNGSYPFTIGYYAVLREEQAPDSGARSLLDWLLGEEGQKIVDRAGFVPLK